MQTSLETLDQCEAEVRSMYQFCVAGRFEKTMEAIAIVALQVSMKA